MKTTSKYLLILLVLFSFGCADDDSSTSPPEEVRLTEGFVVLGETADGSFLAQYFPELPSGTIDLTEGTSFQSFFVSDIFDGSLYVGNTDGSNGYTRIAIDGNGQFVQEASVLTNTASFVIKVRDSDLGVFVDNSNPGILNIFNPQTLAVTGVVDLSEAPVYNSDPNFTTNSIFFRDNDVFSTVIGPFGEEPEQFTAVRGSISQGTFQNEFSFNTGGSVRGFNGFGQRFTDEQGNLYIQQQGNTQVPNVASSILRIPVGSNEFDPDYNFTVGAAIDPSLLLQTLRGFRYAGNGIGYALTTIETPAEVIDLLLSAGGNPFNLSEEDLARLIDLLFNSANGAWVQVNVNTQTATLVPGIPQQSPFSASTMTFIDNTPHFSIANTTDNGFYAFDPATNDSELVFSVTGAQLLTVYNLSDNN